MSAPCCEQGVALADAVDADHAAEGAGATRLDARERVLVHRGVCGLDAEPASTLQERVRVRLALQVQLFGDDAVDAHLDQVVDTSSAKHILAIVARRDHGAAQAGVARRLEVADRAGVRLDPFAS